MPAKRPWASNCITLVVAIFLASAAAEAAIPTSERNALIAFYNATGGSGWTNKYNWLGAPGTEGTWYGVTLDPTGTKVLELTLGGNHLVGSIPSEIASLPNLQKLWLYSNSGLTGAIPVSLGTMVNLQHLLLSDTQISGSIPPEIGGCASLRVLNISYTQLSGSLPSTLGNLANLEEFYFDHTQISGAIPNTFGGGGRLLKLRTLWGQWLQLSGSLPPEMGSLTALKDLQLQGNALTGSIPTSWGGMASIETLYLGGNALTGSIPSSLGSLGALKYLYLADNQLSGPIPDTLGNCTQLVALELHRNQLTGSIPTALGSLVNLQRLYLNDNQLSGPIPATLGNCTQMVYFHLEFNQLTGPIPPELTNFANATDIYLDANKLTGPLPPDWSKLTKVRYLYFHSNAITGPIPASFTGMTSLYALSLVYNGLYPASPAVKTFVDSKEIHSNWLNTQTLAPENVAPGQVGDTTVQLTWTPVAYTFNPGGYEIYMNGALKATVTGKSNSSATVTGLTANTVYVFKVRSWTDPHGLNQSRVDSDFSPDLSVKTLQCAGGLQVSNLLFCADTVTKTPGQNVWTFHGNVSLNSSLWFSSDVIFTGNGAVPTMGTLTSSGTAFVKLGGTRTETLLQGPLNLEVDGGPRTLMPALAQGVQLPNNLGGVSLFFYGRPVTITDDGVVIEPMMYLGTSAFALASCKSTILYRPGDRKALQGLEVIAGQLTPGIQILSVSVQYDDSTGMITGSGSLAFPFMSQSAVSMTMRILPNCWMGFTALNGFELSIGWPVGIPVGTTGLEWVGLTAKVDNLCDVSLFYIFLGGDFGILKVPGEIFTLSQVGAGYQRPSRVLIEGGTATLVGYPVGNLKGVFLWQLTGGIPTFGKISAKGWVNVAQVLEGNLNVMLNLQRLRLGGSVSGTLQIPDFTCAPPNYTCRAVKRAIASVVTLPYVAQSVDADASLYCSDCSTGGNTWTGGFRGMASLAGFSLASQLWYQNGHLSYQVGTNYQNLIAITVREDQPETTAVERAVNLTEAANQAIFAVLCKDLADPLPSIYLRNPQGETVTPANVGSFPGIHYDYDDGDKVALFRVETAAAGPWTLGEDNIPEDKVAFQALVPVPPPETVFTSVTQGSSSVAIQASVNPPAAATTVSLYYTDDPGQVPGTPIAEDLSAASGTVSASWDTSAAAPGTYLLLARTDDGANAATTTWYGGTVTVSGALLPPSNLAGVRANDTVTLTWSATPSTVAGYEVLYTDRPDLPGYPQHQAAAVTSGASVSGLDPQKQYRFAVRAYTTSGAFTPESAPWYTGAAPPADVQPLSSGQTVSHAVTTGSWKFYKIALPLYPLSLTADTLGASGNVDLYLRKGSKPTSSQYDFRAATASGDEHIRVESATYQELLQGGDWYAGVYGAASASYALRLVVEGGLGCAVSCAATVPGWASPGSAVSFRADAQAGSCEESLAYEWDFGDGSARSILQNPTHTYSAAGTYTWTLTASAGDGGSVRTGTIEVSSTMPSCGVDCTAVVPARAQTGVAIPFAASASASGCPGSVAYAWDFGDGSGVSSLAAPSHVYTVEGSYAWSLTVTAGASTCTRTGTVTVEGPQLCTVSCSATVPASGQATFPAAFSATASAGSLCAGGVAFDWNFGDGGHSSQQNPSHTYASEGSYTWTLTASSSGISCVRTGTISISPAPPCSVTCSATVPSTATAQTAVSFQATISAAGCMTVVADWDFGDGSGHSSQQNPMHTYNAAGTYTWTLLVVTEGGNCTRTGTITVTANVPPPVITAMAKMSPFGIKVAGSNLQNGIRVFINGTEWTNVQWKSTSKVKILGGGALKAAVPKGAQTQFLFLNPDGGSASLSWSY
jgi:PKD repeat protein